MKFELIHDTIARQIFDKSSVEAKARRRVISMISRALERHKTNEKVLLTREDLDEIKPFERSITFDEAEKGFIKKSRQKLWKKQQLIITIALWAAIIMAAFLIWALWERRNAKWESRKSSSIALAAKALDFQRKGDDTKALRFAQYSAKRGDTLLDSRRALLSTFIQPTTHFYSKKLKTDLKIKGVTIPPNNPKELIIWDWEGNIQSLYLKDGTSDIVKAHEKSVDLLGFSPKGEYILSNSKNQIKLWMEGDPIILELGNPLKSFQFHPRKSLLYLLDQEGLPLSWDYKTNQIDTLSKLGRDAILLSPDGEELLFLSGRSLTYRYGFDPVKRFDQNVEAKFDPGFLPKEEECYYILVFPKTLNNFPNEAEIWHWCPSKDADQEATFIKIYETSQKENGRSIAQILYHGKPTKSGLIVNPKLQGSTSAKIWQTTGIHYEPIQATGGMIKTPSNKIKGALMHPNGNQSFSYNEQEIFIWELQEKERPFTTITKSITDPGQFVYSNSKKDFAVFKQSNTLKLWDLVNQHPIPLAYSQTPHLAICPQNNIYLTAGLSNQDKVQYHLQTWKGRDSLIDEFRLPQAKVEHIALLNKGEQIATCDREGVLSFWSLNGQKEKEVQLNNSINSIQFSPNDPQRFFTLREIDEFETLLEMYDLSESTIDSFFIDDSFSQVNADFFPKQKRFWTQSRSLIKFWTLNGKLIDSLESADQIFESASISSDGHFFIVVEGGKGSILDLRKSRDRTWVEIPGISHAWLSLNQDYLYTISEDQKTLAKWPFNNRLILQRLDSLSFLDLTPVEKQYFGIPPNL